MYRFILKRLLSTIPVLLVVAVLVFSLLRLTPGDPAAIMLAGDGVFLGGCILPGVELMRFVLHEHTGRLPMSEGAYSDTPRNTLDAIESGCRHAQAGAVERIYRVFRDVELNPLCIVSGGAGRTLVDQLAMPRRYVENLVLDGLARIALGLSGTAT